MLPSYQFNRFKMMKESMIQKAEINIFRNMPCDDVIITYIYMIT